ncbi:MAG: acetylglutamate kinase [Nitriliruptorales bacterium]|nr:acetylglutamate kinase [Nitriliruptorales bacterium]
MSDRTKVAQGKARVLREALPWITRWSGRTLVVKYGGNAMSQAADVAFAADVALLRAVGLRVVVVHGGGPQISALSRQLGLAPRFVAGRRVTDDETLNAVRMALLGDVSPRLVALLQAAGARAAGVSGTDADLLTVNPVPELGLVGDVADVEPQLLRTLLDAGMVPVVASLGKSPDGQTHNVNADAVAAALAVALAADKLIYLTNVPGLYEDFGTPDSTLLSDVRIGRLRELLACGALNEGMVPKITGVVAALDGGVRQAHLLDGRVEHALLLEIFTDEGIGTMVVPE